MESPAATDHGSRCTPPAGLSQRGEVTSDLFTSGPRPGAEKLMTVIDSINEREGRGLCVLAERRRSRSGRCDVTC